MDFKKINVEQITSVQSFLKQPFNILGWYDFKPKSFWSKERKAGFYYMDWANFNGDLVRIHEQDIPKKYKNVYVDGQVVYHKPYIVITLSSGDKTTVDFDSEYELNQFMQSPEMRGINWVAV